MSPPFREGNGRVKHTLKCNILTQKKYFQLETGICILSLLDTVIKGEKIINLSHYYYSQKLLAFLLLAFELLALLEFLTAKTKLVTSRSIS